MVVDAQIDMLGVFLNVVALAKKLNARNIHRHHKRGAEAAVKHRDGHVVVHGRDRITAQHGGIFAQLLKRQAERRA